MCGSTGNTAGGSAGYRIGCSPCGVAGINPGGSTDCSADGSFGVSDAALMLVVLAQVIFAMLSEHPPKYFLSNLSEAFSVFILYITCENKYMRERIHCGTSCLHSN